MSLHQVAGRLRGSVRRASGLVLTVKPDKADRKDKHGVWPRVRLRRSLEMLFVVTGGERWGRARQNHRQTACLRVGRRTSCSDEPWPRDPTRTARSLRV